MSRLHHDPDWPRASAWLRGDMQSGALGRIAVLGAPATRGSISPGRCDLAPAAIRAALDRFSTYDFDGRRDIRELAAHDLGDLDVSGRMPEEALSPIREAVQQAAAGVDAVVVLGGDNSITLPGVRALDDTSLLTFDAHLDLRSTEGGLSNGNPIRALLEAGFPGDHIVQIGIQSFANSAAYARIAQEAGIRIVTAEAVHECGIESVVREALSSVRTKNVYVDFDIDVLDRAFAPAAPGSRPGGLAPWELRKAARLCGAWPNVRVIDIVEVDPAQDIANTTVLAAAACMLSFLAGVHERCSQ
jgi:formiminoglutamase